MATDNKDLQMNKRQTIEMSPEDVKLIREQIRETLDSEEMDDEQRLALEKAEAEKLATLEKIRAVFEASEEELEQAAEEIAPEFDYEQAAKEIELEETAARYEALYGIELLWNEYANRPLPPELVSPSRYPKPRYQAKTALGRFFTRDIHRITMAVWIAAFIILVAAETITYAIPETVHVTYTSMKNVEKITLETRAKTVGDLKQELVEQGLSINENDAILPLEEAAIKDNMTVQIMKATEASAKIAGQKTAIFLIPGTVEDNLIFNDIRYDADDEISPDLSKEVNAKTYIIVDEVHYKTKEKKEKVKPVNRVILDPSIASGVEVRTEGNKGEGIFTYKYKYVNGKKTETDKKVKEWIVEPHDNILHLGTSVTGKSGEYIVVRTFIANCTAYTARPGAGGALGLGVHRGTCAVDPTFVPYRSQMWIEGYGDAFANDCGGAVKGNVVDLFMNSMGECIQWGRRNKTAYVLQPVD